MGKYRATLVSAGKKPATRTKVFSGDDDTDAVRTVSMWTVWGNSKEGPKRRFRPATWRVDRQTSDGWQFVSEGDKDDAAQNYTDQDATPAAFGTDYRSEVFRPQRVTGTRSRAQARGNRAETRLSALVKRIQAKK